MKARFFLCVPLLSFGVLCAFPSVHADATCVALGIICVYEYQTDGCGADNVTRLEVGWDSEPNYIEGRSGCRDYATGTEHGNQITMAAPVGYLAWYAHESPEDGDCWIYFNAPPVEVLEPCDVPPPDPGWGHLLP